MPIRFYQTKGAFCFKNNFFHFNSKTESILSLIEKNKNENKGKMDQENNDDKTEKDNYDNDDEHDDDNCINKHDK